MDNKMESALHVGMYGHFFCIVFRRKICVIAKKIVTLQANLKNP